jgi:Heterokaryon incompatibility protein (HET)
MHTDTEARSKPEGGTPCSDIQHIVEAMQGDVSNPPSGHVVRATYAQADQALRNDANGSLENSESDDSSLMKAADKDVYPYSSLKPDTIRLLGLIPHEDENAPIQCRLFGYPLQESGERVHLYEALSYVWGCSDKPHSISIGRCDLPVTANLYTALLHLRDRYIERTIWVDAICINQNNLQEQGQQIQYMAEIYSKATRVIVWLGEAAADSDEALEEIRVAADNESSKASISESIKASTLALLQRPWFERIWVSMLPHKRIGRKY